MSSPDKVSSDAFATIPDPAAHLAGRTAPAMRAPDVPSPTRAQRRVRGALSTGLALAWIVVVVWRLGTRDDISAATVLLQLTAWTLVGVLGLFATLRAGDRGLPPGVRVVQAVSAGLPAVFLAGVLVWSSSAQPAILTWMSVRGCLFLALVIAVGPLALGAMMFRRSFLTTPAWRGAAIGAVCGMAGAIGIHAHCPITSSSHVLIAHGLPIVVAAAVGAVLGALRGRI
jgi:hypothetical protein